MSVPDAAYWIRKNRDCYAMVSGRSNVTGWPNLSGDKIEFAHNGTPGRSMWRGIIMRNTLDGVNESSDPTDFDNPISGVTELTIGAEVDFDSIISAGVPRTLFEVYGISSGDPVSMSLIVQPAGGGDVAIGGQIAHDTGASTLSDSGLYLSSLTGRHTIWIEFTFNESPSGTVDIRLYIDGSFFGPVDTLDANFGTDATLTGATIGANTLVPTSDFPAIDFDLMWFHTGTMGDTDSATLQDIYDDTTTYRPTNTQHADDMVALGAVFVPTEISGNVWMNGAGDVDVLAYTPDNDSISPAFDDQPINGVKLPATSIKGPWGVSTVWDTVGPATQMTIVEVFTQRSTPTGAIARASLYDINTFTEAVIGRQTGSIRNQCRIVNDGANNNVLMGAPGDISNDVRYVSTCTVTRNGDITVWLDNNTVTDSVAVPDLDEELGDLFLSSEAKAEFDYYSFVVLPILWDNTKQADLVTSVGVDYVPPPMPAAKKNSTFIPFGLGHSI